MIYILPALFSSRLVLLLLSPAAPGKQGLKKSPLRRSVASRIFHVLSVAAPVSAALLSFLSSLRLLMMIMQPLEKHGLSSLLLLLLSPLPAGVLGLTCRATGPAAGQELG